MCSDTPPYTPAAGSGVCDGRQWAPFGDRCFAFYVTERVSFARAAFTCGLSGATLVSIHDNATNTFLTAQVKAASALPVWIGFRRSDSGECFGTATTPTCTEGYHSALAKVFVQCVT